MAPDKGRGTWTTVGGLLPAEPGGTGPGFYRLADTAHDELDIGSMYVTGEDKSHIARTINLAVQAFQSACEMPVMERDGWLGPKTHEAGVNFQNAHGLKPDGLFGPETMRQAFLPLINLRADLYMIERRILLGIVEIGSGFDPGAVSLDGERYGLCQVNLGRGTTASLEFAMNPDNALDWTAKRLRSTFNLTYVQVRGITRERAWDVAILSILNQKDATRFRDTGVYPSPESEDYVQQVRMLVDYGK